MKSDNHIKWIDIAKGIGIICVVYGHIYNNIATEIIYIFHMPLFFFLGGYLHKPKKNLVNFARSKYYHLIVPFISYFLITFTLLEIFLLNSSIKEVLVIIYKGVGGWMSTFWFPICFLLTQQFFNFLIVKGKKYLPYIILTCLIIAYLDSFLLTKYHTKIPWSINVTFYSIVIYSIGYWYKRYKETSGKDLRVLIIPLIILGIIFYPLINYKVDLKNTIYGLTIISLLLSLLIIYVIFKLSQLFEQNKIISEVVSYLGAASMVIMYVHPSIIILSEGLLNNNLFILVLALGISSILYYLFSLNRTTSKYLIGVYKPHTKIGSPIMEHL